MQCFTLVVYSYCLYQFVDRYTPVEQASRRYGVKSLGDQSQMFTYVAFQARSGSTNEFGLRVGIVASDILDQPLSDPIKICWPSLQNIGLGSTAVEPHARPGLKAISL